MSDGGHIDDELHFDYLVYGRPISMQLISRGSGKKPKKAAALPAWRDTIRDAAREAWDAYSKEFFIDPLRLDVFWIYDEGNANDPDLDNIVKPFIDSLEGLLFELDSAIREMHLFKFSLREDKLIGVNADKLIEAFASNREFIYVRVTPIKRDTIRVVSFVR